MRELIVICALATAVTTYLACHYYVKPRVPLGLLAATIGLIFLEVKLREIRIHLGIEKAEQKKIDW